jgi:hypothetical protein
MDKTKPWYLTERAEILAMVMLTRLPNLVPWRPADDSGVDLFVSTSKNRGGRVFGLVIKAETTFEAQVAPDQRVLPAVLAELEQDAADTPFPTGILILDMSDDSGYFGWYIAPGPMPGELQRKEAIEVVKVNDELLQAIADEVDGWYDARARLMTRSA